MHATGEGRSWHYFDGEAAIAGDRHHYPEIVADSYDHSSSGASPVASWLDEEEDEVI